MPLPKERPGSIFISSYTAPNAPDGRHRGVTVRLTDEEGRIVCEADVTFEAFGRTAVGHTDVPCFIRWWTKAPRRKKP